MAKPVATQEASKGKPAVEPIVKEGKGKGKPEGNGKPAVKPVVKAEPAVKEVLEVQLPTKAVIDRVNYGHTVVTYTPIEGGWNVTAVLTWGNKSISQTEVISTKQALKFLAPHLVNLSNEDARVDANTFLSKVAPQVQLLFCVGECLRDCEVDAKASKSK